MFAVNAKNGNIIWRYEPEYEEGFNAVLCCGPIHRGVALKDDLRTDHGRALGLAPSLMRGVISGGVWPVSPAATNCA